MVSRYGFSEDEMVVDQGLGYPRAYAKICRDRSLGPYSHGPPFTFIPYALPPELAQREKELEEMFPIIDTRAKSTAKPTIFLSLLWKQLNHLGNAGFNPAMFRVDPYGNVLYYHADSASPLAWEIDHWFPCSRGGLTVPSNLRILQWQVRKRKHDKLEILVPWWDLQLGISVNQFLSIFAVSNSDFRHRAFSLLFREGPNEDINGSHSIESHNFPQPFVEAKDQLGLAPASIVLTRKEAYESNSTLRALDINRQMRPSAPIIAVRKSRHGVGGSGVSKENENPDLVSNPYQAIVLARDSLKQREETSKMKMEIQKLDDQVAELKQRNEEEKATIQDLELALIKRRRRAEKCRRLAEAQASYRSMLEKMIRDAMHQSVVYKEQVRLNYAATNALMARLEAQKAICDSAEKQLHNKFKQRDDLEKQIRPEGEQTRKRSRMHEYLIEDRETGEVPLLPGITRLRSPTHKELRVLLEEEQRLSEDRLTLIDQREHMGKEITEEQNQIIENLDTEKRLVELTQTTEHKFEGIGESQKFNFRTPLHRDSEIDEAEEEQEEDEESRRERGKGNVEKWLQLLLGDYSKPGGEGEQSNPQPREEEEEENGNNTADQMIKKLNENYPKKDIKVLRLPKPGGEGEQSNPQPREEEEENGNNKVDQMIKKVNENYPKKDIKVLRLPEPPVSEENSRLKKEREISFCNKKKEEGRVEEGGRLSSVSSSTPRRRSVSTSRASHVTEQKEGETRRRSFGGGKGKELARSESARQLRPSPSSPSIILGMRKGVDCMRKKPLVVDDEESDRENVVAAAAGGNKRFLRSSIMSFKKAARI